MCFFTATYIHRYAFSVYLELLVFQKIFPFFLLKNLWESETFTKLQLSSEKKLETPKKGQNVAIFAIFDDFEGGPVYILWMGAERVLKCFLK